MNRALLVAAAAAAAAPLLPRPAPAPAPPVRWPATWEGRALRPLPPAPEDARLARDFPGRIARFSDGRRQVVLRRVAHATRALHPPRDCFAALGYRITPLPMRRTRAGYSSCFEARRPDGAMQVCERIVDARGASFPDVPAWYWPALLGWSPGPWTAAAVVERVRP
jgi:hypothetical protein